MTIAGGSSSICQLPHYFNWQRTDRTVSIPNKNNKNNMPINCGESRVWYIINPDRWLVCTKRWKLRWHIDQMLRNEYRCQLRMNKNWWGGTPGWLIHLSIRLLISTQEIIPASAPHSVWCLLEILSLCPFPPSLAHMHKHTCSLSLK